MGAWLLRNANPLHQDPEYLQEQSNQMMARFEQVIKQVTVMLWSPQQQPLLMYCTPSLTKLIEDMNINNFVNVLIIDHHLSVSCNFLESDSLKNSSSSSVILRFMFSLIAFSVPSLVWEYSLSLLLI